MTNERISALATQITLLTQLYDQLQQLSENLSEEDRQKVTALNSQYFELLSKVIPDNGFSRVEGLK